MVKAVLLVVVSKTVLVTGKVVVKVLRSVEVLDVLTVVVLTGVLTSTSMFSEIVIFACVELRESPTAQPSLLDSM